MLERVFMFFQKNILNNNRFYFFTSSIFISAPSFAVAGGTNYTVINGNTYTISDNENITLINNGNTTVTTTGTVTGTTTNNSTLTSAGTLNTTNNYGQLSITGGATGDITNYGAITFSGASSSNITNEQNATFIGKSGAITGDFDNSGSANLTSTAIYGGLTNQASGTFTTSSTIGSSVDNYGALNLTGMAMVQGGVTNYGGTLSLSGPWTYILGTLDAQGGTFNMSGGMINALSGSANGVLNGLLTITRASNTVYSGVMSGTGGLSISGGVQSLSGANTYTGNTSVNSGASLILTGSIAGNLTNNSNASHPTSIGTGATVSGNVINTGALTVNGTVGGQVNNTKFGSITASTGAIFDGSVVNAGTTSLDKQAIIQGGVTNTSGGTFNLTDFSNIMGNVNNAGTLDVTSNAEIAGNVTNSTNLNMDAGTILGAISNIGVVNVQNASQVGSIENKSGTSTFSNSTITQMATNDSNGTFTISGGTTGSVANAGTMTLTNGNTVLGDVDNSAGSLTLDGDTINGKLYSTGGSFSVTGNGATIGSLSGSANGSLGGQLYLMAGNSTYSGTLSGAGSVKVKTSGTQIFSGDNTYTGVTEIESGTLAVDGDQNQATGDISINNSANLSGTGTLGGNTTVYAGGALTPGGVTSRVGTLNINQNLTLESGSTQNFYLGQTNVSGGAYNSLIAVKGDLTLGGTLDITANTAGSSVHSNVFDPGLYRLYTYDGTLSGVANQSIVTTNVAPGSSMTLQTSIAQQVNLIVDYGSLTFWDGGATGNRNNGTVDGGNGIWTAQSTPDAFNWTNKQGSLNGAWVNNAFVVYAGNAGTVTVQDTNNGQTSNIITSGMQFANNDGKSYTITGDDIYAATSLTTMRVGDGTTAGASITAIFDTVLNDQLVTNGTSLKKTDLGTLIITRDQTYQGDTTIDDGVLQLGNGGTAGALAAGSAIHDNGTLAIDHSDTFTLAQTIDGTGGLAQTGPGTTVLNTNNSYSGDTSITNGTLEVDGSIANSTVTASNGGTLTGTGMVGNTIIAQGGTLAAPGVQGSLTVQGNLQTNQNAALVLQGNDQLSGATMTLGGKTYQQLQSGFVNVTGSSSLSGTVVLNVAPSIPLQLNEYYTLATSAAGFSQKSSSLLTNLTSTYTFMSPSLFYNGNDLDVLMARNALSFAAITNSRNERETAQMLDRLPQGNAMVQAMQSLGPADARQGMNALSGEVHASARTALVQDSLFVRQMVLDRLDTAECETGHADDTVHTASLKTGRKDEGCRAGQAILWGQAYGSLGHNGGDGNAAALHHSSTGFAMGVDAPFMDDTWRIGAMLGYGRSMFDITNGRSSSGHGNNVTLGGYAGTHWGALNLRLGAAYTWNMLSLQRNVLFPGYSNRLSSDYMAGTAQGFGELGYQLHTRYGVAEPFANVAYVNLHTNGYHEHGGAAALRGYATDTGVTLSTFGIKASSTLHAGKLLLIPHGSLAYRHTFGLVTPTGHAVFAAGGNGSMDIAGAPLSVDAAVLDAGLSARLSERVKVGLSYIGQYGNQSVDSGIKADVQLKF